MPAPLFKVEVAFADGPNASAPSWTDISSYVRRRPPLTYSRGNTDETQQLQSGSMRFVVDNTDGRFTPGSSASTSAWGTALKIRRPVRLSIWNGASVVEWTGTVDDWGAGWRGGKKGESLVICSDRVAQAGRVAMPPLLDGEILSDAPIAFYPMTEPAGATSAENLAGTSAGTLVPVSNSAKGASGVLGGVSFGEGSVGIDGQTQALFTLSSSGNGVVLSCATGGSASSSACSADALVYVNSSPSDTAVFGFGNGVSSLSVSVGADGIPYAYCRGLTATAGRSIVGSLVHLAATYVDVAGTGTVRLYINGTQTATATGVGGTCSNNLAAVGGTIQGSGAFDGYISHFALYSNELTAARVLAHAQALQGFPGEFSGARWNRLCRIAGMGSTTYTADAGQVEMGAQPTAGQTLASLLQTVGEAEQGYAFASADGVLTLKAGTSRYGATSAASFTPQQLGPELQWITNDAYLVNDATVSRTDGGTRRSTSSTSKTDYGTYGVSPSLPFLTDDQCTSLSSWLVYKYADPGTRADGLSLDVTAKALTASTILGIDVSSLITLSPMPAPAPASSVPLFVDGLEGAIGDTWQVSLKTSPGTIYDGWTLDTDTLGTGTLLLY